MNKHVSELNNRVTEAAREIATQVDILSIAKKAGDDAALEAIVEAYAAVITKHLGLSFWNGVRPNTPEEFRETARVRLAFLSPEERVDLFSAYCKTCGGPDPSCPYWNDE